MCSRVLTHCPKRFGRSRTSRANNAPIPQPHSPNATLVDCAVYAEGHRLPGKFSYAAALDKVRQIEMLGHDAFVWVGLREPDHNEMQEVADVFGMHPLAVEDAVCAHQRPKLERYDETVFLVLKTVNYVPHESVVMARQIVETGEIMVFVGKDFVVTVRHGEHGGLSEVRKRMDADPEQLRLGPFAVMHAIADDVVDRYLEVSSLIESDIDSIEEVAFAPGSKIDVEPVYLLKREVVELRRCVSPLSAAFHRMQVENKDLDLQRSAALPARRRRPPIPGGRPDHQLRRHAQLADPGGIGPGRDAAEQRHAQDGGLGRHLGGAHHGRRHLRDELPFHARVELDVGIPGGHGRDDADLSGAVLPIPEQQLALAGFSGVGHLRLRASRRRIAPIPSRRAILRLLAN